MAKEIYESDLVREGRSKNRNRMETDMSEKLVLMDGHSILNRAFFGIPDLTNSEGLHTNAVYGFLNIMFKILEEEKPDYLTVAFDVPQPTFRHEMFAEYKGTRKPMAAELREQVPLMKEMLSAMGVTVIERVAMRRTTCLERSQRAVRSRGLRYRFVEGTEICCSLPRSILRFVFQRQRGLEQRLRTIMRAMWSKISGDAGAVY